VHFDSHYGYTFLRVSYSAAEAELRGILKTGQCLLGWEEPEKKVVEINEQISVLQNAGVDIGDLKGYLTQVEEFLQKSKEEREAEIERKKAADAMEF